MGGTASSAAAVVLVVALVAVGVAMYLIPTIVAVARRVPNTGSVVVINIFFGWTLVGWVLALSMASRSRPSPTVVNVHASASAVVAPQYQAQPYPGQYGQQHGGATAYGLPQPGRQPIEHSGDFRAIEQRQPEMSPEIPAGWYPDPYGVAARRYWDSKVWTEHTA